MLVYYKRVVLRIMYPAFCIMRLGACAAVTAGLADSIAPRLPYNCTFTEDITTMAMASSGALS